MIRFTHGKNSPKVENFTNLRRRKITRALNIIHIEMIVCLYFCDVCFTHATCPCSEIYLLYIEAISLKLKLKVCQNKKDILLQLLHTFTLANVDAAEHRTLTNRLKRVKIFCRWQVATNVYIVNPAPPLSYHQMILATVSTENKEKTREWVLGAWHFYRQHQVEMEWRKT